MKGKKIILGITGSIAAYKAADLTSALTKEGVDVHCVMTDAAQKLIQPLTLQVLSKNPVHCNLWNNTQTYPLHITLANKADLLLVAPASARILASFAHGLADDLLTNIYLATQAPIMIAPAMNGEMLRHPAVQNNLKQLEKYSVQIIPPQEEGLLACGYEGEGKLAFVETILAKVKTLLN